MCKAPEGVFEGHGLGNAGGGSGGAPPRAWGTVLPHSEVRALTSPGFRAGKTQEEHQDSMNLISPDPHGPPQAQAPENLCRSHIFPPTLLKCK